MARMTRDMLIERLGGGLVVSCQPVPGGPFDSVDGVLAFARAAASAGARGLRIEGAANVAAVVGALDLPVIGLIKRDLPDSPVRITPWRDDVAALAAAGASVIAVDATDRPRPVPVAALLGAARVGSALAMADCATLAEAEAALASGADILGSTLSGYTGGPVPVPPDLALVGALARLGAPVLAEGRYNTPPLAAAAIRAGATAVVVGSAITRPEHVTSWFHDAVTAAAGRSAAPVLAFDIGGTKTLAALVRGREVLERRQVPTHRAVGAPGWTRAVAALGEDWAGRYDRASVAATGLLRGGAWSSLNPDVLRIPDGFRLSDELAAVLGVPVVATNDAQASAWGEYRHGAGEGRDLLFVTVSSGIGGGVVTGGRLLHGARGLAGSLGQVPWAADAGTLEEPASGFGMARAARAAGHEAADARAIFTAATTGAAWAEAILAASAEALARALVGAQALLDPECIILGGGVGLAPDYFARVDAALGRHPAMLRPQLLPAALGTDGGIIGAADLAGQNGSA